MKSRRNARPGRKLTPCVVRAKRPANRHNVTGSSRLRNAVTMRVVQQGAVESALALAQGKESQGNCKVYTTSVQSMESTSDDANSRCENSNWALWIVRPRRRRASTVSWVSLGIQLHDLLLTAARGRLKF